MPVIFNTTLASYKDRTVKAKALLKVSEEVGLTDLSCEVPEAAAASEPIPPPPPTAAVTTPPIAPVRTQYRKRETEIETLLLEVLRKQAAPVPPPGPLM
ncbi:unnamed protein product [Boreogadus saida]